MVDSLSVLTRRRLLQFVGSLSLGGLWRAQAATRIAPSTPRPIRACILIFYYGGPSHLDTFDLKPDAPKEVRGEFKPISTSVTGVRVCEHLPRLARWMHKCAIVRSMTHSARLHDSASIHALTGRPLEGPDRELFAPKPQTYPSYGSAVAYLNRERKASVPFAALPFVFHNVVETPCQGGGMLGSAYDPLRIEGNPSKLAYHVEVMRPVEDVNADRARNRRGLLNALERRSDPGLRGLREKAHRLLASDAIHRALDISREPLRVRERYGFDTAPVSAGEGGGGGNGAELGQGRQLRGQNLLLARRLVEAGVPFVNVYDFRQQGQNWDAHFKCFNQHRRFLLPMADQSLSALIEDLDVRGLLDSTLVIAMGEFGRTPKINGEGGRDHWPDCYSVLLAGGGVSGGAVYGASDRLGAYPASDPVTPGDLAATIFWRFGLDHSAEIHYQTNRPHRLAAGEPIRKLFGGV
jgi:hypothetical protein